jgi:hypothetical protein
MADENSLAVCFSSVALGGIDIRCEGCERILDERSV